MSRSIPELESEIKRIKKDLKVKTEELAKVQKQFTDLKAELNQTKSVLVQKDAQLSGKDKTIAQLQKNLKAQTDKYDTVLKENKALKATIADLTSKYTVILEKYDAIKAQVKRPIATPTQLAGSFKKALEAMKKELKTSEESPVDYTISKFDVILKTSIGVDEKERVTFLLPKVEEVTAEHLSTVQFSIRTVPKVRK